jgi:hypothetical protein
VLAARVSQHPASGNRRIIDEVGEKIVKKTLASVEEIDPGDETILTGVKAVLEYCDRG